MVTLGGTSDPTALIPGDPAGIAGVAGQLYNYATLLTEAGNGLQRIDTSSGWQGSAADAFRARFQGQPSAWLEAGSCFSSAAKALDDYVPVLSWAQQEAAEAITQWHAGNKKAAQTILDNAVSKAAGAAATATAIIGLARDKAPQKPGFWSDVGGFFSGFGGGLSSFFSSLVDRPLARQLAVSPRSSTSSGLNIRRSTSASPSTGSSTTPRMSSSPRPMRRCSPMSPTAGTA